MNDLHHPLVYLVDDDEAVRDAFALLLAAYGHASQGCADAQAFRAVFDPEQIGCVLMDVRMPGTSGLHLLEQLRAQGVDLPIVMVTGHGELAACRRAFTSGAFDFLTKPVDESTLIDTVQRALREHIELRRRTAPVREAAQRLARLSEREREVLAEVSEGLSSKEIARKLALSPRTVESHRARIFEKLEARSLAEVIRIQLAAGDGVP
jgi:two-component system response regulator FixJ